MSLLWIVTVVAVLADSTPTPAPDGPAALSDLPGWVAGLVAVAIVGLVVALLVRLRRSSRLRE